MTEQEQTTDEITTPESIPCAWPDCDREHITRMEVQTLVRTNVGKLTEAFVNHPEDPPESTRPLMASLPVCSLHQPLVAAEILMPIINADRVVIGFYGADEADRIIAVVRALAHSDEIAEQDGDTPLGFVESIPDLPAPASSNETDPAREKQQ